LYKGVVYKSCLSIDHTKGLCGLLNARCEWKIKLPRYPTTRDIQQIICDKSDAPAVVQIAPVLKAAPKIVYYDNCMPNLYAAVKRQCTAVCLPDPDMMKQFHTYMLDVILPEWVELLENFHYSYEVWYNHLTRSQQMEIDDIDHDYITSRLVKMFCKAEKQMMDGAELPKNRAISALCAEHKYVLGPLIYALEQYFKKWAGYAGGCNWEQLGKKICRTTSRRVHEELSVGFVWYGQVGNIRNN